MRLCVVHETTYRYASPVVLSRQQLHLEPRPLAGQELHGFALEVSPAPVDLVRGDDYFGNPVSRFAILAPHTELTVRSRFEADVAPRAAALAGCASQAWEAVRDDLRGLGRRVDLAPQRFLFESPHVELLPELAGYARPTFMPGRPLLDALRELAGRIHADYLFDPSATSVATPLRDVIARGRGVCQDFAHLMIGCLRALGLPARYVSGYILTHPPAGRPQLVGAEASHAWVSAWWPPVGWVDVDPTNDCLVDDEHVTLAWGRDFSDVTPLRGVILGGDEQTLQVAVTVSAAGAAPR